jgi:oxepin-CoA hydrolase/3-oxo-5,6-dehydrosuberyl-CoA semialdehyde dehydrogenase
MPVLEKPGTPTAMMAERIAHIIVDSGILPEGAFSFLAGGAGDLLDHVDAQDCVAFTGSSGTAQVLRAHAAFVQRGARLNAEADSLNASVLGPDVEDDCGAFDMFLREMSREMTQKAGQKCTAVRRILVPEDKLGEVGEALVEALARVKVGDPADGETRMGPLTNAAQLESVRDGLVKLRTVSEVLCGGDSSPFDKGPFQMPTLLRASAGDAAPVHADEIFGPVATLLPYSGSAEEAAHLVSLGGGGLLASLYSDDRRFSTELALGLAPWSGRVYMGSSKVAEHGMGQGLVLPSMTHGGPGRAGGGEELGGLRGLAFYMQRTAVQGFKTLISSSFAQPSTG